MEWLLQRDENGGQWGRHCLGGWSHSIYDKYTSFINNQFPNTFYYLHIYIFKEEEDKNHWKLGHIIIAFILCCLSHHHICLVCDHARHRKKNGMEWGVVDLWLSK